MDLSIVNDEIRKLESHAAKRGADPARWLRSAVDSFLNDQPICLDAPPLDGPLFVYDALKPGELAHPQVSAWALESKPAFVEGYQLYSRDGLPLLVAGGQNCVQGILLRFSDPGAAYDAVRQFEPGAQYEWIPEGVQVEVGGRTETANALRAVRPDDGTDHEETSVWSSASDPVFTDGVAVAAAIAEPWLPDGSVVGPTEAQLALFHLQAAYLLIWSAVERFTALRFGPAMPPMKRIRCLGELPDWPRLFEEAKVSMRDRKVIDSRDPREKAVFREDGRKAWRYWYQVRSNLSHRGKAALRDHQIVAEAFVDVHDVLRLLLLGAVPRVRDYWLGSDPEGEGRGWRLRSLSAY